MPNVNELFSLKGRTAIVTGGGQGLGKSMAIGLAQAGADIVIAARRIETALATQKEIEALGVKCTVIKGDMRVEEDVIRMVNQVVEEYGKIDILINNASNVGLPDGRVDEVTLEMWDNIFQTDLRGTFFMIKTLLPYIQEHGGSIVNIGSMASCGGDLGATAYASAKAGVDMLTKSVALQYGKQGIRCNCVRPGLIVTPQNDAYVPQALKDIFLNNICVTRYGKPADIANLCVYLASDESEFVTGQIMTVDGGMNSHVATVGEFKKLGGRTW